MKRFVLSVAVVLFLAGSVRAGDAIDIRQLITAAIAARQSKVVIPPGVHHVSPAAASADAHLTFTDLQNFEIDGPGATLVFTDPTMNGLLFKHCRNITLRNFTVDYDPLPFTQGTVRTIDQDAKTIEMTVDAGYLTRPTFFTEGVRPGQLAAYLFDPATGDWKTDAFDLYLTQCEQLPDGGLRLNFANASLGRSGAAVGDRMVLSRRTSIGIRLIDCDHCSVSGVTLFSSGGLGVQEAGGDGENRYTFAVTRGPTPDGATMPRLHSINADGFHSAGVKNGPLVENCLFEWMGDDAITVHGSYALAAASLAPDRIILSPKFDMPFQVGDELTALDGNTDERKAAAHVKSVSPTTAPSDPAVEAMWERYHTTGSGRTFYEVQLDQPFNVTTGDLITSPQRVGNGYIIRGNTCRHHRARGIQLKAGDGVVENNLVEDVNMGGIVLGPELSIWLGSDYVQHVVIRNNLIRETGRGGEARDNAVGADIAGICVRSIMLDKQFSPPENRDILIEGNRIERTAGLAMFLSSTTGLTVRNNIIVSPWQLGSAVSGKRYGVDPTAALFLGNCKDVTLADNSFDYTGGSATHAAAAVNVSNAVGLEVEPTTRPASAAAN